MNVIVKIAGLAFFILFLQQLVQSVTKLLDGDVIAVTAIENQNTIELPMITICKKGMKGKQFKDSVTTNSFEATCKLLLKVAPEDWLKCYENITYSKSDIVKDAFIRIIGEGVLDDNATFEEFPWKYEELFLSGGPYGLCIRLDFNKSIDPTPKSNLKMEIPFGNYDVYVHDPKFMLVSMATNSDLNQLARLEYKSSMSRYIVNMKYFSIEKTEMHQLSKKGDRCNDNPSYSFYDCWKSFMEKEMKCQLSLFPLNSVTPNCSSFEDYKDFQTLYLKQLFMSSNDLEEFTGCGKPCSYSIYSMSQDLQIQEIKQSFSSFGLVTKNSIMLSFEPKVTVVREKVLYDGFAFLGEVGGSLGLFLGASMLSMTNFLVDHLLRRKKQFCHLQ